MRLLLQKTSYYEKLQHYKHHGFVFLEGCCIFLHPYFQKTSHCFFLFLFIKAAHKNMRHPSYWLNLMHAL